MTSLIRILAHTQQSYAEHIFRLLGKGCQHAGLVYEEFFRTGCVLGKHPAFVNAKSLFHDILALTDFSCLSMASEKNDGATGKILLRVDDRLEVESVLIPMRAGGTLCVSSQVGCRMGCAFCETGKMGLLRQLTPDEIVSQVFVARHHLHFDMRNIVFMGMGEPFDNYENVIQAVRVLCDPKGMGFGHRRITISTSGCVDGIMKLIAEGKEAPNLAISLSATQDEERNKLMPINRRYNLTQLHAAMLHYCTITGRQILVAYVLLKDVNDSLGHADRLADYLQGLDVKVNLIPYNPQTRDRFSAPEGHIMDAFAQHLRVRGYRTLLRTTKGQRIMAACGQLGNIKLRSQLLGGAIKCVRTAG